MHLEEPKNIGDNPLNPSPLIKKLCQGEAPLSLASLLRNGALAVLSLQKVFLCFSGATALRAMVIAEMKQGTKTTAFVTCTLPCSVKRFCHWRCPSRIWMKAGDDVASPNERVRQYARDFLTQRAVQQIIFTSRQLRDETSAKWLDDFTGGGLEERHVCNALRFADGNCVSTKEYLTALLSAAPESYTIRKPFAGRGGSTKTNPYLETKYFEYQMDIVPQKLGRRVLEARLQIAKELESDLRYVADENARLWRQFRDAVEHGKDIDIVDALDAPFSSALLDPTAFPGVEQGSPYREANYDLALNYTLHCGLVSVMSQLGTSSARVDRRSLEWLQEFAKDRAPRLLYPPRGIRRLSDSFVAGLLSQAPAIAGEAMLDPMRLCEQILNARLAAVTDDWIPVCAVAAEEHLEIEKGLLEGSI